MIQKQNKLKVNGRKRFFLFIFIFSFQLDKRNTFVLLSVAQDRIIIGTCYIFNDKGKEN